MTWLVTGGAGYIGAHLVHALREAGTEVVVLDDLSTGLAERLPEDVPIERGTLLDPHALDRTFGMHAVSGVAHLAAKKRVDESLDEPLTYYRENVEGLRLLLERCAAAGVASFLFSSSAAVYGDSVVIPIDEEVRCVPVNPYGHTKLAGEWLTHAVGAVAGMRTLALRYFNVAGTASAGLADAHADNLVPLVLGAIRRGEPPQIFGDDYPTPDGTCIRDYVHVADVADAHVAAVRALERGNLGTVSTLNIGTGRGVSVREIVDLSLKITGSDLEAVVTPRRRGDPSAVVADVHRAAEALRWRARRDVSDMVESAWAVV
ncbi:MAG TPA: UDP-glucose 4-epimerase GalE [Jiangellaceae bacterium]|nr:UDP-glucose 4-epimerase GalE [Jiangellaceae bacterium]